MIDNNINKKDELIKEIKPFLNPSKEDLHQTLKKLSEGKCNRLSEFIKELQLINRQFYIDKIESEKGKISAMAVFHFDCATL